MGKHCCYAQVHLSPPMLDFMKALLLSLCLTLCFPLTARADEALGWQAYKAGDFVRARELFAQAGTPDGFAAACRTGLVLGGFYQTGEASVRSLHRALDDCKAAVAIEPTHVDAHISYAIGLGFEGKRLKKAKYAKASLLLLEDLLVVSDDYGILHAALGGWHTSVYEAGFFARLALGGKRSKARAHFERAVALAPEDIGVRYEFIKYLAYGKSDERQEALTEIATLATLPVRDIFDRFLLQRAQDIGAMIEAEDKDGLEAALEAATAFTNIREQKDQPAYPLEAE
ncbi:hypothetical protein SAMN04488071_0308 [Kordiimonas lacus]|uniref:Tetratricopeptide repeat-containing protein n=2 Tax=Kordiimonas lacus TaxID=637679 RepID=A0A1G6TPH8_9PROT|nr:hypothetical protein SAMN04488071_0308 [Kordiimonas lacus]